MPERGDPFARVFRSVDDLAAPRREFADALLARLLEELAEDTGEPKSRLDDPGTLVGPSPVGRGPNAAPNASSDRQQRGMVPLGGRGRARGMRTMLATAALVLL